MKPSYIISEPCASSNDSRRFPLLAEQAVEVGGRVYPTAVALADGAVRPLFAGGVVSAARLERIAAGVAALIADSHQGRELLLIEILEGARPFYRRVVAKLAGLRQEADLRFTCAALQVRSYSKGSQAGAPKVLQPLRAAAGQSLGRLAGYDAVLIIDDLIDAGNTFAWLVEHYLPGFQASMIEGYFMLDKAAQQRSSAVRQVLATTRTVCGVAVPIDWVVGYGLDLALPGPDGGPALHLFRNELPGGIYIFNHGIEQGLRQAYQANPAKLAAQLAVYQGW